MNIDTDTRRYYNATFVNTDQLFTLAEYRETRTSPILSIPSEWYMSVIRFDVDTSLIPINIPIMVTNSIIETLSQITIFSDDIRYTQTIDYSPDAEQPFPYSFPAIYNYSFFLGAINEALSELFIDAGLTGFSPYFFYDPVTQLISLYIDNNFISIEQGGGGAEILLNPYLQKYLTNFTYTINNEPPTSITDPLFYFLVTDTKDDIYLPNGGNRQGLPKTIQEFKGDLYQVIQTAPGINSWNSLRSILLTSSSLPFRTEFIPSTPTKASNYISSNIFPILIDHLVPQQDNPATERNIVEFLPTAQFSYIDLVGTFPLNSIDFKFYWTDFQGNIYPLFLSLNGGLSIKILFEKKKTLMSK